MKVIEKRESRVFENGSDWVRVDFHLHTKADKEFKYTGDANYFARDYVQKLVEERIALGVITNHNKFDLSEFKELRKVGRRSDVELLPGVELSVNDGANGVHCLVVFSDEWIEGGKDYINPFLTSAFPGKSPEEYQHENGRTDLALVPILSLLEKSNKDFFVVFAHVEQPSGLWVELKGGRIEELSKNPLVQKYCLGFQKVRSYDKSDKPDKPCRKKVSNWWKGKYPAEVEGSDPKKIGSIGNGTKKSYLKIGASTFDAVKFALQSPQARVSLNPISCEHSFVRSMRFEGGLLDEKKVSLSSNLNCFIGIRGSGKSSILECLRYALDVPRGDHPQDVEYKDKLVPHVLKSGGAVVVEVVDTHGEVFEVKRISGHQPVVLKGGVPQKGVDINSTLIRQPLYFGQKDLAASGDAFGKDLVEKLIGHKLSSKRAAIKRASEAVKSKIRELDALSDNESELKKLRQQRDDLVFRVDQFKKYGLEKKLEDQELFDQDKEHFELVSSHASDWKSTLEEALAEAELVTDLDDAYSSSGQKALFVRLNTQTKALKKSIGDAASLLKKAASIEQKVKKIGDDLGVAGDKKAEAFARAKRELAAELAEKGIKSIDLQEYLDAAKMKSRLDGKIERLEKKVKRKTVKKTELARHLVTLNEAWLSEFKETQRMLKAISESQDALAVDVTFKGEEQKLAQQLKETLTGHGLTTKSFNEVAEAYADAVEIFNDLDAAATAFGTKSELFKELFTNNLEALLPYQVPNGYEISYQGKPLSSHSLGQRASAMIIFILAQDDNDVLIVDQPEDDLDNQTVYDDVVKLIQVQKQRKQFLLATHNANFPVLGDAEMVVACAEAEDEIKVVCNGIDARDCQERIVKIMEGGAEAFERRRSIYEQWRAS